jgi:hypothetical protein
MGKPSVNQGRYLYAIISGSEKRDYGHCGIGDGTVYTLTAGDVAAVVSDVPDRRIRPERRLLAAHNNVLKHLMEDTSPLPMSFGIIADGPEAIRKILTLNLEAILSQLRRVEGKVEMGLRLSWSVPNIFEYFVSTCPDLKMARDRFFAGHREPSQEDKIELGRMFERLISDVREEHVATVEEILSECTTEIKRNKCRSEREVMSLACLIARDAQEVFEEGIFKAAGCFNNDYTFDFSGPWAPHNFVDIDLRF